MQKKISIIGCNKDALVLVGMRKPYLMILLNGDKNKLEHFYGMLGPFVTATASKID